MRCWFAFFAVVVCSSGHAQTNFNFPLAQGSNGVGLRLIQQYDDKRTYPRPAGTGAAAAQGESQRPLQTLVWYPAGAGAGAITNADYLTISRRDENFNLALPEVERKIDAWVTALSTNMPKDAVHKELERTTFAQRDATPATGKYPVIIYAPGFGSSAHENADLCEYLASHGYVVMASPSIGSRSRAMTQDLDGIETQAADIRFLIDSAKRLAQADLSHIGVIGFSWGGISSVVAAARDERVRALVSLEGAFRYVPNFVDGSAGAAKDVSPSRVAIPLLYVAARPKSIEDLNAEKIDTRYSFINSMTAADVYVATMRPMQHMDFASQLLRFTPPNAKDEYTREEVTTAYGWTVRYVHQFLDAYLKNDTGARAFLQQAAAANGAPAHMMSIEKRMPTSAAPK